MNLNVGVLPQNLSGGGVCQTFCSGVPADPNSAKDVGNSKRDDAIATRGGRDPETVRAARGCALLAALRSIFLCGVGKLKGNRD